MAADPFEDVLYLEDHYYLEGYQQGATDGNRAGQIEGRTLGLETGFKKFFESGRLYGRTVVWANRLGNPQDHAYQCISRHLPPLSSNARLQKHVRTLYALVEPGTLSVRNMDEAVTDFDNRMKRASGKARIVEKATGELSILESSPSAHPSRPTPALSALQTAATAGVSVTGLTTAPAQTKPTQ